MKSSVKHVAVKFVIVCLPDQIGSNAMTDSNEHNKVFSKERMPSQIKRFYRDVDFAICHLLSDFKTTGNISYHLVLCDFSVKKDRQGSVRTSGVCFQLM